MKSFKVTNWISMTLIFFFIAACGGGSSSNSTGTLSLGLTDASTDEYDAVYVSISEIQVHNSESDGEESGWISVATPEQTFNLLELINGVIAPLGVTYLEAGKYSQMRLYLSEEPYDTMNILGQSHSFANYVILKNTNNIEELKIPSGYQSGIKMVHGFEILEGLTVDLVVDFDASASVVKSGNSGKYLLKPTIKITDTVDNAILSGTVTDDSIESVGLGGVTVSAQYYEVSENPGVFTSTITESEETVLGEYLIYLPPDDYTMVAYKQGYLPDCKNISAIFNSTLNEDFVLSEANESGTIEGSIQGLLDEQSAIISFRKRQICSPEVDEQIIEVDNLNLGNVDYAIDFPAGVYDVFSLTNGIETFVQEVTVGDGTNETLDFDFTAI